MVHAALTGFILLGIFKILDKHYEKKDDLHVPIDWYMSFALVIVSTIAIVAFNVLVAQFNLPAVYRNLGYLIYLIIPFFVLKILFDYHSKKSFIYVIWIPFVALLAQIPFALLMNR